ncbi:MAG: HAMP domain-containing sensor histidine kinase [Eubacteriales bacterium]|nr:HAMP domain-containing sensor histidine kinase [Eubacteriales bacterium]
MVKKLRIRFITVAMLSVMFALTLLMVVINGVNYRNVVTRSDWTLTVLANNNGTFPKSFFAKKKSSEASVSDAEDPIVIQRRHRSLTPNVGEEGPGDIFQIQLNKKKNSSSIPFETRYFSVLVDSNKIIKEIDSSQILVSDADTLTRFERKASRKLKNDGDRAFIGDFRCTRITSTSGTRYIFLDCSRSLDNFRAFRNVSILTSVIGVVIVFLLILFFSRNVLRPVEESYEKQRRFITDAGHEIRTPLTIINADISVMEMTQEDGEPNEWLQDIKQQTSRLATLTNELVYLTRMEESQKNSTVMKYLDFTALVREVAKSFDARARVDHKDYSYDISDGIALKGDESALQKLISILLDNAFKYSSDEGEIRLAAWTRGKTLFLTVSNSVDSINPEELPHLFDRFYRSENSRNTETGGHGIGLSIAQAVVRAHGGKIGAYTEDGNSLRITATIPL